MNLANYQSFVERNASGLADDDAYCIIALNEEAGEVAGWYKKFVRRGNPKGKLEHKDLAFELGDVLWYLTKIAKNNGWTLEDIMVLNHTKLTSRMEDGKKVG
jgi:NTP pyrophosphatase (non-canonical NTP hydrolase)